MTGILAAYINLHLLQYAWAHSFDDDFRRVKGHLGIILKENLQNIASSISSLRNF